MTRISGLMILPPVLFFGLAGVFIWGMARPDPSAIPSVLIGQEAPAVTAAGFPGAPGFTTDTLRDGKVKIVNFWASWCGPCRMVSPIIDEIATERADLKVGKVNVDEQPELAAKFGVMSIPTLIVMKDGKVVNQTAGARPKPQILSLIP